MSDRTSFHQDVNEQAQVSINQTSPLKYHRAKQFSTKASLTDKTVIRMIRGKSKTNLRRPASQMIQKVKRKKKDFILTQKFLPVCTGSALPLKVSRRNRECSSKFHLEGVKEEFDISAYMKNFSTEV